VAATRTYRTKYRYTVRRRVVRVDAAKRVVDDIGPRRLGDPERRAVDLDLGSAAGRTAHARRDHPDGSTYDPGEILDDQTRRRPRAGRRRPPIAGMGSRYRASDGRHPHGDDQQTSARDRQIGPGRFRRIHGELTP